ncbi:5-pentadecatrienyl resorcinol O-methyltransferase [Triticum urartu]|uniref:5-pentadecatrienyl resorcinol O-methyltransferase n=1 Tax=Triticum urartu TaxID=4572 RepID=M8AGI4_TRIUA|nr:5-pentadecatrienyl resorcinol O-methyltransferase [Triticum urartu]
MALKLLAEVSPQELLVALAELQNHVLGYVKSMSLKCAVDLGITDAIHRRGGTATLADIAADTKVHPARVADLRHVLELLSESGIFSATSLAAALLSLLPWLEPTKKKGEEEEQGHGKDFPTHERLQP